METRIVYVQAQLVQAVSRKSRGERRRKRMINMALSLLGVALIILTSVYQFIALSSAADSSHPAATIVNSFGGSFVVSEKPQMRAVRASLATPISFEPVKIEHYAHEEDVSVTSPKKSAKSTSDTFVDAMGIVNNISDIGTSMGYTSDKLYANISLNGYLQQHVAAMATKYDLPKDAALVMMGSLFKESSFRYDAVSGTNDYGIGQINICNHQYLKDLGVMDDWRNPFQSIEAQAVILSDNYHSHSRIDNWHALLMCYNMGYGTVKGLWAKGIYSSTYSRGILSYLNNLGSTVDFTF